MEIKKKAKSFNSYTVELSFGQLEAIRTALEEKHDDVLSDELLAELIWYLDRVPGPGEDEDELKAKQEQAEAGGAEGAVEGEDLPIPMPPGSEAGTPPDDGSAPLGEHPNAGGKKEPKGLRILKGEEKPNPQHGLPEPGMEGVMDGGAEGAGIQPGQPPQSEGPEADVEHRLPPPPRE